jgi:hypothetical protein
MSFAHVQAEYLISQIPWTSDDSFENVVFEWLKLISQHPCKKKQDFEKLFATFRNNHFNKFLHNNANSSEFVKLVCDSVPTSKKEYEELFLKISAYKRNLEPMPGGHSDGVPVAVLWSLGHRALNKVWYKDEVGHVSGKCCQCLTSRRVSFVVCQEPACPATSVWLCPSCSAPPINESFVLPPPKQHEQMLANMRELYILYLSSQETKSPLDVAWSQHYRQHEPAFQVMVANLNSKLASYQHNLTEVEHNYFNLQQWADRQMSVVSKQLQQAYNNGQQSCQGYDLRYRR